MKIVPRSQWGAKRTPHAPRPLSVVTGFYVHYHGTPPPASTGTWVPKSIEAIHLGNGWNNGVGYHFVVDQAGTIYEGRGWGNVGAHSPPHNRDGLGVYVAIGGNQKPTEAALRSVRWLYDEACRKTGKTLYKRWHGYDYPTACPGPHLIAWVKAGMPASGVPTGSASAGDSTDIALGNLTVKQIQELVGVTVDGIAGPATVKAVKELQAALGVTADGLVGTATEGEIMSLQDDIAKIAADVKEVKTEQKKIPARVWAHQIDTPKSVLSAFPWFNKKFTAGGAQMYNLFSFSAKDDTDKIIKAIKDDQ